MRNQVYDILTGRPIIKREAVNLENAIDYVKSQGFLVYKPIAITVLMILMIGIVSAQSFLVVDFTERHNLLFVTGLLIVGLVMLFSSFYLLGATIITLLGLIMLFSDVNTMISSIIIFMGIMGIFLSDRLRA